MLQSKRLLQSPLQSSVIFHDARQSIVLMAMFHRILLQNSVAKEPAQMSTGHKRACTDLSQSWQHQQPSRETCHPKTRACCECHADFGLKVSCRQDHLATPALWLHDQIERQTVAGYCPPVCLQAHNHTNKLEKDQELKYGCNWDPQQTMGLD